MQACSSCVIKGKGVTQEHVGRVLPMSMPKLEGHSANVVEIKEDSLERKLLSMSRGGSNNQRLLSPSQKKGLVPARGAAASLRACFLPMVAPPHISPKACCEGVLGQRERGVY
jgi:hypothetical protein